MKKIIQVIYMLGIVLTILPTLVIGQKGVQNSAPPEKTNLSGSTDSSASIFLHAVQSLTSKFESEKADLKRENETLQKDLKKSEENYKSVREASYSHLDIFGLTLIFNFTWGMVCFILVIGSFFSGLYYIILTWYKEKNDYSQMIHERKIELLKVQEDIEQSKHKRTMEGMKD